jgi:hypothetical protein
LSDYYDFKNVLGIRNPMLKLINNKKCQISRTGIFINPE